MEPIAERAWGRQHHSSHLSTVGGDGRLAPNVGSPGGGVRRAWMAWTGNGRRQTEPWARHVLGRPDWAQPYGPWQGWYQAQSPCGWRGRPLEHCWLREPNVHAMPSCWRRPWLRHCGRTSTAHRGGTPTPVSVVPKGIDNPSLARGAAAGHGYRDAHPTHRRGEAGRLWRQAVSGAPVGCGTDAGMALQVPCGSWSGTTRRQRTTSVCYSSHVRSCGSGDSGVWPF